MLETLSEFDDTLLEQLIEDIAPEKSLIYRDLHDEFGADQIVPVLLGAGDRENGVRRLLKALRHDTPFVGGTAKRRSLPSNGVAMAECFKVLHQAHAGKLSLCRVWSGNAESKARASAASGSARCSGRSASASTRSARPRAGEIVALAKLDALSSGQSLSGRRHRARRRLPAGRSAGLRAGADRQEPQRRGQALGRPAEDRRGGSLAVLRARAPRPMSCCSRARARCI